MKLSEFSEFEDSEMAPWKRNAYDETAKRIYEASTGRGCPESVKVI
jgi:hypothetical protein